MTGISVVIARTAFLAQLHEYIDRIPCYVYGFINWLNDDFKARRLTFY
jgi:hypothetical protein